MLPDMEGFDVANRLGAQRSRVPVVFLTARDATEDKIRGLTLGGDDYVTKPFSLEEVIARIRAVLRRTRGDGVEPTPQDRKSTRLNSSHSQISYAVFCLKKKMDCSAAPCSYVMRPWTGARARSACARP